MDSFYILGAKYTSLASVSFCIYTLLLTWVLWHSKWVSVCKPASSGACCDTLLPLMDLKLSRPRLASRRLHLKTPTSSLVFISLQHSLLLLMFYSQYELHHTDMNRLVFVKYRLDWVWSRGETFVNVHQIIVTRYNDFITNLNSFSIQIRSDNYRRIYIFGVVDR